MYRRNFGQMLRGLSPWITFSALLIFSFAADFNYKKHGDDWQGVCKTGQLQAPIALNASVVSFVFRTSSIPKVKLVNYDTQLEAEAENNGHSVQMQLKFNGPAAHISGGLLAGNFLADSVHFHWGSPNSKGSEHTIDSRRYDAEMHIVHKNYKFSSRNVGNASTSKNGIAVLAVLIEAVPDKDSTTKDSGIIKLFEALPVAIPFKSKAIINVPLTMRQLLGVAHLEDYFTYEGSLTIPECGEPVTWIVFSEIILMPQSLIANLWKLRDIHNRSMVNIYRNLQPINNRKVFYKTKYQ